MSGAWTCLIRGLASVAQGVAILAATHFGPPDHRPLVLGAGGTVAVAFGVVLMVVAPPGAQAVIWLVAGFAIVEGALWFGAAVSELAAFKPPRSTRGLMSPRAPSVTLQDIVAT